jgi:dipeptidyl aminopeptidase/acylaminoacyl peptidase
MVLIYPVISFTDSLTHSGSRANLLGKQFTKERLAYFSNENHVTPQTPPVLLVHCADDSTVAVGNSLVFYQACIKAEVPVECTFIQKVDTAMAYIIPPNPTNGWTGLPIGWKDKD